MLRGKAKPAPVANAPAAPIPVVASPSGNKGLRAQRRRLSVVSDNQFIEGVAPPGDVDVEDVTAKVSAESVVKAYAGVSKKGYAPYNPRKRNQDAIFMEEVIGPAAVVAHGPSEGAADPGRQLTTTAKAAGNSGNSTASESSSTLMAGSAGSPLSTGLGSMSLHGAPGGPGPHSPRGTGTSTGTAAAAGAAAGGGGGGGPVPMRYCKTHVFGVFDGHGEAGDLVSHHFAERLPGLLASHHKWGTDPAAALVEQVAALEKALLDDGSIDSEFSGSTGIVAVVRQAVLTVANIGDSRCILGRTRSAGSGQGALGPSGSGSSAHGGDRHNHPAASGKGSSGGAVGGLAHWGGGASMNLEAVGVSDDHKPDRPDEQRRILSRGGRVFAVEYDDGVDGPPRVWLAHMDIPGLAMSRSLGDTVAHTVGVISTPELHHVHLGPADRMLILASDGLWEFMSNQEVIDMVCLYEDPRKAVDALIAEANARWMREEQVIDDTTVIVAFLDIPPPSAGPSAGNAAAVGPGVRMAIATSSGSGNLSMPMQ